MALLIALSFLRTVRSPVIALGSKERDTSTKSFDVFMSWTAIKKEGLVALLFISVFLVLCTVYGYESYFSYLSWCSLSFLDKFSYHEE